MIIRAGYLEDFGPWELHGGRRELAPLILSSDFDTSKIDICVNTHTQREK